MWLMVLMMGAAVAGCGGTAPPATTGTTPPATGATPAATRGATPAVTSTPPAAPGTQSASLPAATAGEASSDFCLNTVEEVEAALQADVAAAVGTENPGFGGACTYNGSDGLPVYAIAVVPSGSGDALNAALAAPGAVELEGIGERAVLVSAAGPLVVQKSGFIMSIGALPTVPIFSDATAYPAAIEQLGRAAIDRL